MNVRTLALCQPARRTLTHRLHLRSFAAPADLSTFRYLATGSCEWLGPMPSLSRLNPARSLRSPRSAGTLPPHDRILRCPTARSPSTLGRSGHTNSLALPASREHARFARVNSHSSARPYQPTPLASRFHPQLLPSTRFLLRPGPHRTSREVRQ